MDNCFDKVISIKEACSRIGVKENTLRFHISKNKFVKGVDCKKYGNTWIFTIASLKELYPNMEIGLLRGDYDTTNYPTLIEVEGINDNSNLIGYTPADQDLENCPRLIIDKNIVIGLFRGYYFTNLVKQGQCTVMVDELVKNKDIISIINKIATDSGIDERYYSEKEVYIINKWLEETAAIYDINI